MSFVKECIYYFLEIFVISIKLLKSDATCNGLGLKSTHWAIKLALRRSLVGELEKQANKPIKVDRNL